MKKTEKVCEYPDCTEKYLGNGKSKYCLEHKEIKRLENVAIQNKKKLKK